MAQVVSPGAVGTWSHDTPFEHMNVFLPRSVLARSAEDLVAGNPENVEVSNQFETKDEVVALVRYAAEAHLALVPYGAGSGVCAGIRGSR